jgi:hypothetical protein
MNKLIKEVKDININNFDVPIGIKQRGVADLVEDKTIKQCQLSFENVKEGRSKKSTEDMSFGETLNSDSIWYDIKTHDVNGDFCMPNLISMDKIFKEIIDVDRELFYWFQNYKLVDNKVTILEKKIIPYWKLELDNLGIGNLGTGQLQIKDMKNPYINENNTKEMFQDELVQMYISFLKKLQVKTLSRINYMVSTYG